MAFPCKWARNVRRRLKRCFSTKGDRKDAKKTEAVTGDRRHFHETDIPLGQQSHGNHTTNETQLNDSNVKTQGMLVTRPPDIDKGSPVAHGQRSKANSLQSPDFDFDPAKKIPVSGIPRLSRVKMAVRQQRLEEGSWAMTGDIESNQGHHRMEHRDEEIGINRFPYRFSFAEASTARTTQRNHLVLDLEEREDSNSSREDDESGENLSEFEDVGPFRRVL